MAIYNAETTIRRMLDSIKKQSFTDFEVLMINDGSTDETKNILEEYANNDVRFKLIDKINEGVSATRQRGVELASGKYLIHADSDDWFEPQMLERLYDKAQKENSDIVISDFYRDYASKQVYVKQKPSELKPNVVLREMFQHLHGSCCNKLVKRICYRKFNVSFPKGVNYSEDLITWVQLLLHSELKISYLPEAYYHYCENNSSITRNYTRATYEMHLKYIDKLNEILKYGYDDIKEQAAFGVFIEGVAFKVLNRKEILDGLGSYRDEIFKIDSLKWKLGFCFLFLGFNKIASKLVHF